jgi:hypothetical protein
VAEEAVEEEKEATAAGEDEEKEEGEEEEEEEEEEEARTGPPHDCCWCTLSPSTMMFVRLGRFCARAKRSGGRRGEVVRSGTTRYAFGAVAMIGGGGSRGS